MRRVLSLVSIGVGLLLLALGAAYAYFLYSPAPQVPRLSASVRRDTLRVGESQRSYVYYVPAKVAPRPPLLLALHGSMGHAGQMRRATAYRFEQLADDHGFILAYPEGYEGHWNDCRKKGPYAAKRLRIDDVSFMRALIAHFRSAYGVDSGRVFAVGLSNGAHLGYRLALEAPELVRAIAAVAANLPTEENFDCTPVGGAVPVLILNGTEDPINPFAGGRVTIFGFGDRGSVLSAHESAAYFARRNGIAGAPVIERIPQKGSSPTYAERSQWRSATGADVVLYTIHGGGHTLPLPRSRGPRILGRTHPGLDGPAEIWRFFARHSPSSPKRDTPGAPTLPAAPPSAARAAPVSPVPPRPEDRRRP
jgi:polyhydroxybutyrate depolymerase